jgi:hypothetical protein
LAGKPANLQWFETPEWDYGSQWYLGTSEGDPSTLISSGPSYVSATSNLTKLYNRPSQWTPQNAAVAIKSASRTIVWINGDYVVIYDRAKSKKGLFKRENFELQSRPKVVGNVATETTPNGQELYVQSLQPTHRSITFEQTASKLSFVADTEPMRYTLTIQDPSRPAAARFLTILQGADPGAPMTMARIIHSTRGTAFDGAQFGNSEVYFIHTLNAPLRRTTFPDPGRGTTVLITGLRPQARVGVSTTAGNMVISPGGASGRADASGVLRLRF